MENMGKSVKNNADYNCNNPTNNILLYERFIVSESLKAYCKLKKPSSTFSNNLISVRKPWKLFQFQKHILSLQCPVHALIIDWSLIGQLTN